MVLAPTTDVHDRSAQARGAISASLEDYLETIYLLVQAHGFARVRDIAGARSVKAATVSMSLRKLADAGLVDYTRREYIALTPRGEEAARRVLTRHRLLTRFFEEVLQMPAAAASDQACAMEHSLTDEAMDRLVRYFEFLGRCPTVTDTVRSCPFLHPERAGEVKTGPCAACIASATGHARGKAKPISVADLKPGEIALVEQVATCGALRQRLLDMGILPNTPLELERSGLGGDPLWIRCQGARLALRRAEASTILVRRQVA